MNLEGYKWVVGFEGLYLISKDGNVYSNPHQDKMGRWHGGVFLKPILCNNNGYYFINLYNNGKHFHRPLHILIAQAFIPNPLNKPQVDHIDGDKTNNSISNLRWATAKENMNNPNTHCRMSDNAKKNPVSGSKNPYSRVVGQYTIEGEFIKSFESCGFAAKATGLSRDSIIQCARGITNKCGGYKWVYLTESLAKERNGKLIGRNGMVVGKYGLDGQLIEKYVSLREAARQNGFKPSSMSHAVRRGTYKNVPYKGFIWKQCNNG
jgi:hypothetical protein